MKQRIGYAAFASSPAPWLRGLRGPAKAVSGAPQPWLGTASSTAPASDVVTRLCTQVADLKQQLRETHRRLRDVQLDAVSMLVAAAEAKDPVAERHSMHVAFYAESLARPFNLSSREAQVLKTAAMLHDIGKIGVPDAILTKPGPLTEKEYLVVKAHPLVGAAILESAGCLQRELPLVLYHHEQYQGGGYPYGLRGEDIPFGARILHVADAIDAMLSPRAYKESFDWDRTCYELRRGRGIQFDPAVAEVAIAWLDRSPVEVVESVGEKQLVLAD